jgi:toxin CptA
VSFDTTVELRLTPSVRLLKLVSTLHIVPLALLPFAMQPGPAMWGLIAAFALSWFGLRRSAALGFGNKALLRITWHADGNWTVHDVRGAQAAVLQPNSTVHAHWMLLRFVLNDGSTRSRLIAGDDVNAEALRHLRARLSVWRQPV